MTAQEIKQLKDEDIIGFHRVVPPFLARRMDWRQVPKLVNRQHIPPPTLASLPKLSASLPSLVPPNTGYPDGFLSPDMEELATS